MKSSDEITILKGNYIHIRSITWRPNKNILDEYKVNLGSVFVVDDFKEIEIGSISLKRINN